MKTEVKFYICRHCGNVAFKVCDQGTPLSCCGEEMQEMVPRTADAGLEKHVPVLSRTEPDILRVHVGATEHPMLAEHSIQFICLETDRGFRVAYLSPGEKPQADFCIKGCTPVAVYEYCNIHGLWKQAAK